MTESFVRVGCTFHILFCVNQLLVGHLYVPMEIGRWLLKIKKLWIVLSKSVHVIKKRNNLLATDVVIL